jgi:PBP1b-binding outer membrane lipoprotein LpoB
MKISAIIILVAGVLVGCGKLNGTMDATQQMPDKMDQTFQQIKTTNDQMKTTNDTVKQEPVAIALEKLQDPANGSNLLPIPFDLMPWAETFGQYASTDQVIKIVYLWVQKLNTTTLDIPNPTDADKAVFNQRLMQTFMSLESVCGLLPDDKVQQIVKEQIGDEGRFQTTAMQMLMLRVRFLRDVMINSSLLSEPIDNAGKLEQGIAYANSIEYVARLPYANKISVDIVGFLPPIGEQKETLDPKSVATGAWSAIKTAVQIPDKPSADSMTGDPKLDKIRFDLEQKRKAAGLGTIDAKLKAWN